MLQRLPYFALLLVLFTSCGPTVIYEQTKPLPGSGWTYADSARFDFTIPNAEQAYDLVLELTYEDNFPSQNFYVQLHTGFPSGKRTTEQLSLQLAGDFGAWLGDCGGGSCEQELTILRHARFKDVGDYYLTVVQHTREEALAGVGSVGLVVREAEE
jgi:gliding motility-associated lipoprotein GldH